MGNNWTLHVIDPASIARFVDHFLGRTAKGETAFDSLYDVEALYAKIHEAIEREPIEAGLLLLEALAKARVDGDTSPELLCLLTLRMGSFHR